MQTVETRKDKIREIKELESRISDIEEEIYDLEDEINEMNREKDEIERKIKEMGGALEEVDLSNMLPISMIQSGDKMISIKEAIKIPENQITMFFPRPEKIIKTKVILLKRNGNEIEFDKILSLTDILEYQEIQN